MEFDFADVLLQVMDRNASDLHLTAGSPPMIRQHGKLHAPCVEKRAWGDEQSIGLLMRDTCKRLVDVAAGGDVANDDLLPAGGRLCFA